jgi:hypothetical protein
MANTVITLIDVNPRRVRYGISGALDDAVSLTQNMLADLVPGPLRGVLLENCVDAAGARVKLGLTSAAGDFAVVGEDHRVRSYFEPSVVAGPRPGIVAVATAVGAVFRADFTAQFPAAMLAIVAGQPVVLVFEINPDNFGPGMQSIV